MKKLQIHVPVYNEEKNFPKFIDSAKAQFFRDVEYIFHDKHSNDRTLELIQNYLKYYPNCFYRTYSRNTGMIAHYFQVKYFARDSELVGMRSANDLMSDAYIECVMELLETDPMKGIAYSHTEKALIMEMKLGRTFQEQKLIPEGKISSSLRWMSFQNTVSPFHFGG